LTTPRKEAARLVGLGKHVRYPVGRIDLEYQLVDEQGRPLPDQHMLQLVVTDHEALQLAKHFADLAQQLARSGGTKQ
jgi:hypothetical protein